MKKIIFISIAGVLVFLSVIVACQRNDKPDASGVFESDEVIVSAEQPGKILSLNVQEGDVLQKGVNVGQIDVSNFEYQKEQIQSTIGILPSKTANAGPQLQLIKDQLSVQETNLNYLLGERERVARLLKADAATQKQYDDLNAKVIELQKQMVVTKQQLAVYTNNVNTQNKAILSEKNPMEKQVKLVENQISKGSIINPLQGTVLTKYAMEGEMAGPGKALYKIANLDTLTLRAYIDGAQLSNVKLGQPLTVRIDQGEKDFKEYKGTITWISSRSEFTPKTIQTKDERANLVYAVKIRVPNDGLIKLGMYGEVKF
jgi:HlyD family secretion protein